MSATRRKAVRALSRRRSVERTFSSLASIVIIPGVCAVLGAFTPDLHHDLGNYGIGFVWFAVLVLLAVFAIRLNPTGESLLELAVENEDQQDKIAQLTDREAELSTQIDRLAFESSCSLSVRAAILTFARMKVAAREDLRKAIDDLASPLYLQGEYIFQLQAAEAWNFAVYLYSDQRDMLIPVWREKARRHEFGQGSLGREWGRGQGHVGKAFVDKRVIITGDALSRDAEPFSTVPPDKEREYDKALYRSFASVPIGPLLEGDGRPYGVLVATSDRVGRFDRGNAGILEQIAGAIASLLIAGELDIDKMA